MESQTSSMLAFLFQELLQHGTLIPRALTAVHHHEDHPTVSLRTKLWNGSALLRLRSSILGWKSATGTGSQILETAAKAPLSHAEREFHGL